MKKNLTRITACFMAALMAVNLVAIPKAKAVVTEAAIGTAALASYMTATGVPLSVVSGGAGAVSAGVSALAGGYAAATGTTSAAVMGSIAAGTTISTGGLIVIGVAAAALLAGIVAWAVNEYGLEDAEEPVYVGPAIEGSFSYNGVELPDINTVWTDKEKYPYAFICQDGFSFYLYVSKGNYWSIKEYADSDDNLYAQKANDSTLLYYKNKNDEGWNFMYEYNSTGYVNLTSFDTLIWTSFDMPKFYSENSEPTEIHMYASAPLAAADPSNSVGLELAEDYEAPPKVADQHALVINTGLTAEDEQGIVDAVLAGIAANTFAPTYTIETDSSGDTDDDPATDPDAGTDDDTEVGLLGRIANGIDGLPGAISEGIASVFAPDPALMTEISSAFGSKFGFVSTLHALGTDLLSLEADTGPPVIYINLDDAEGQYYYGGQVAALDLSWYARYKEDVDRIMSGFLWLGFLWLLFKRASAILQGAEMISDYSADLDRGFRFRGERNGKRF